MIKVDWIPNSQKISTLEIAIYVPNCFLSHFLVHPKGSWRKRCCMQSNIADA